MVTARAPACRQSSAGRAVRTRGGRRASPPWACHPWAAQLSRERTGSTNAHWAPVARGLLVACRPPSAVRGALVIALVIALVTALLTALATALMTALVTALMIALLIATRADTAVLAL